MLMVNVDGNEQNTHIKFNTALLMIVGPYWNKKGFHERNGMYWGHWVENTKFFKIQMGSFSLHRRTETDTVGYHLMKEEKYSYITVLK